MARTFNEHLSRYAELLVKVGVNLQPGQQLVLRASTANLPLAREITRIAYEVGSPNVDVLLSDDALSRLKFTAGQEGTYEVFSEARALGMLHHGEIGSAMIAVLDSDPELFADINPAHVQAHQRAWGTRMKAYAELQMADQIPWSLGAAPSEAWAKKVFPNLPVPEAIRALWDNIFAATRVLETDPVAAWREHNAVLAEKRELLNQKNYRALHLTAPGTDLTVGLADGHRWDGGASTTPEGVPFVANMPTEEVYTAPHRMRVDGTVRATMPLARNGVLIDDFELTFKNGEVVHFRAGTGEETLRQIIQSDEGSRRLGEMALVPASSPIAKTGILFYETLFDENAAAHIALGKAYATNLHGGAEMSPEEREQRGLNDSLEHVDFMIGSNELNVDGITQDGQSEPVMRNGEWV